MKPLYYSIGCMLWLAACSSPAAQNRAQSAPRDTITKKDKFAASEDTASWTATTPDTPAVPPPNYEPVLFVAEDQTVPPYGLKKVEALVKKIPFVDYGSDESFEVLDPKLYASLSLPEQFTYHMIHPESYSQNCDILPVRENEEQRIFGHWGNIFGEYNWSERQLDFFKNNRDTVMQLMKPIIEKSNRIGDNFRAVMLELNATKLIPCLIDCYKKEKKDHYILTLLMLLMKNNQYPEFMNSTSYKKLYGQEEGEYAAWLVYNKANEDLIIQRATNFYNGLQAK
jgi:hypothetical protein